MVNVSLPGYCLLFCKFEPKKSSSSTIWEDWEDDVPHTWETDYFGKTVTTGKWFFLGWFPVRRTRCTLDHPHYSGLDSFYMKTTMENKPPNQLYDFYSLYIYNIYLHIYKIGSYELFFVSLWTWVNFYSSWCRIKTPLRLDFWQDICRHPKTPRFVWFMWILESSPHVGSWRMEYLDLVWGENTSSCI